MSALKQYIHDVEDFPKQGVVFRDISPLLAEKFPETIAQLAALFPDDFWDDICTVAGVDARGFIFASALAAQKNKRLLLVRKAKKLPPPVVNITYALEYGEDALEVKPGTGRVLIMDDVLATGGTLAAAADVCAKAGYDVRGLATLIDLTYLNQFSWNGLTVRSLIQY